MPRQPVAIQGGREAFPTAEQEASGMLSHAHSISPQHYIHARCLRKTIKGKDLKVLPTLSFVKPYPTFLFAVGEAGWGGVCRIERGVISKNAERSGNSTS